MIKHGVKLTAMPAWGRTHSDDSDVGHGRFCPNPAVAVAGSISGHCENRAQGSDRANALTRMTAQAVNFDVI